MSATSIDRARTKHLTPLTNSGRDLIGESRLEELDNVRKFSTTMRNDASMDDNSMMQEQ